MTHCQNQENKLLIQLVMICHLQVCLLLQICTKTSTDIITTKPINLELLESLQNYSLIDKLKSVSDKVRKPSETKHCCDSGSIETIRQLALDFSKGIRHARKADIEPEVFSGNPLEFEAWQCDFDSHLLTLDIKDGAEKIKYLKKYVPGPAKESISGQFLIRTDQSCQQTRRKLKSKFGNKLDVARSMKNELENWSKISSNDVKEL